MINLAAFNGSDVLVQFKHALYLVGGLKEGLVVVGEQGPALTDRVSGKLSVREGQAVVSYSNPADPRTQVDIAIDPDNVASVWIRREIVLVNSP